MATAKRLPSGNYRCQVYDKESKKYKSFTAKTKKEAELMAAEFLNGKSIKSKLDITLKDAIDKYISERTNILSPASISKYKQIANQQLSSEFVSKKISVLTEDDIKIEINRLSGKYSPKTVKNAYGFVYPIINIYRNDLNLNITLPKQIKKNKIYPNTEEIMRAFDGDRIELEVLLALCYGLRKEEIRGLMQSDFNGNIMTINRVKIDVDGETIVKNTAKTVESRRQLKVADYILKLIAERKSEYICNCSGHALYMHFKRVMKQIGYEDITFHDLRHINASVMLALGIPDKYAMERGGWSTNDTLKKVYQSTFSQERQSFDDIIDNHFSKIYHTKYHTKHKVIRKYRIVRHL